MKRMSDWIFLRAGWLVFSLGMALLAISAQAKTLAYVANSALELSLGDRHDDEHRRCHGSRWTLPHGSGHNSGRNQRLRDQSVL